MADVFGNDTLTPNARPGHSQAFGNGFVQSYSASKAAANGDVLHIGIIPAGTRVDILRLIWADAGTSVTAKVGYKPVDTTPTADDDYWIAAGLDIAAAAGSSFSVSDPITFERDVYITLTVGGADFTGTPKISVNVVGQCVGVK